MSKPIEYKDLTCAKLYQVRFSDCCVAGAFVARVSKVSLESEGFEDFLLHTEAGTPIAIYNKGGREVIQFFDTEEKN